MADSARLRQLLRRARPSAAERSFLFFSALLKPQTAHFSTENSSRDQKQSGQKGRWFTLPPYAASVNGAILGKRIAHRGSRVNVVDAAATTTTALKWVLRCCPELPRSLVQKLFRLRKVRRDSCNVEASDNGLQLKDPRPRRVAAKDLINVGDRIFLPITVQVLPTEKYQHCCTEEEVKFTQNLVLYKDPAIIVVNKPPGMPVQGGVGVRRSLDELAGSCLSYDYSEPPRLVHRLDRDCSGILVMARTQTTASILHSIFREKTSGASKDGDNEKRVLEKRYWALVIGSPRRPEGLISAPLGKVGVDNGRSERMVVLDNAQSGPSQHALTVYRVIKSCQGYTWLELSPLTGRKHQLRVHCAEVLGTPIVGDYKYGWQAHRNWEPFPFHGDEHNLNASKGKNFPFGLDFCSGSIIEKHLRLHLHCKQMVLPNISLLLQNMSCSSDYDIEGLENLELNAPLPSFMRRSWAFIDP